MKKENLKKYRVECQEINGQKVSEDCQHVEYFVFFFFVTKMFTTVPFYFIHFNKESFHSIS